MRPVQNIVAAAMLLLGPGLAFAQFSFTDLSSAFPDGADLRGLSLDGNTVLGSAPRVSVDLLEPMYYRDGRVTFLPLGGFGNGTALSMALDGTIVGGLATGASETISQAAVWRNGSLSLLEHEPGGEVADARAISQDGHVVVGRSSAPTHAGQAARWVDGVVQPLGDIPGSNSLSHALAVSADGSVIVGEGAANTRAFRWVNGMMEALPLINGSDIEDSTAYDVSSDGRRIVGQQTHFNFLSDALLWEDGVPRNLGYLPGTNRSFPYAISGDGNLVLGESGTSLFNFRAFVWDDANGIQDLMQVLSNAGVDFHGWTRLAHIIDVSADGHTILGFGDDAQGGSSYFIATIPEPGTVALTSAVLPLFARRRRRS